MKNYRYNPLLGHYRPVDEAEEQTGTGTSGDGQGKDSATQNTGTQSASDSTDKNADAGSTAGKLEANQDYQKLIAAKNEYARQLENKVSPVRLQRQRLAVELGKKGIDPELSGKIIQLDSFITKAEMETRQKTDVIDKQILALRQKLQVCEALGGLGVPEKYHGMISEGCVDAHKVYLNELFDDFAPFYSVFENTGLVYGSDDENVFVLVEDYDDVNAAKLALMRAGVYEMFVDEAFRPLLEKQEPEWFFGL